MRKKITQFAVVCINCQYCWTYTKGTPKYRIRCPKCHSSQNDLNRKIFGKWRPSL